MTKSHVDFNCSRLRKTVPSCEYTELVVDLIIVETSISVTIWTLKTLSTCSTCSVMIMKFSTVSQLSVTYTNL